MPASAAAVIWRLRALERVHNLHLHLRNLLSTRASSVAAGTLKALMTGGEPPTVLKSVALNTADRAGTPQYSRTPY